jgi:NADPH2:quinone reductase
MLSGQYQHMPALPYTPGLEYSGVVTWAGSDAGAERVAVGDQVFVSCLSTGPRSDGDYQSFGGFASFSVAPASAVRRIPEGFSFDQAANFAGNYETAYHCLVACGQLKAGETVLIHGASGSTGLAAVQVAKALGATVIATGRTKAKLDVVREQGADHIIVTSNEDGSPGVRRFRDEVKALTDGEGVDVIYDGVGGDISLESLRCVRFGGRFLIVGWASTPFVAGGKGRRGAPNVNTLPTNLILMKGLQVIGCPMVIATTRNPAIRERRLKDLMGWQREGKLSPHISHTFPLTDVKEALRAKWDGLIIGGCSLHP